MEIGKRWGSMKPTLQKENGKYILYDPANAFRGYTFGKISHEFLKQNTGSWVMKNACYGMLFCI